MATSGRTVTHKLPYHLVSSRGSVVRAQNSQAVDQGSRLKQP